MKNRIVVLVIMAVIMGFGAKAQLTITAEFRPRAEIFSGYGRLNADSLVASYLISQRTRLGVYYQKDWIKTGLSLQDVRIWGDDDLYTSTGMFGSEATVDLNEAWVQLSFLDHSSVKIGRQLFNYDDYRLLSTRNWNQRGISYDALLYQFRKNKWDVDLAVSYHSEVNNIYFNYFPSGKMKTLNFLRVQREFNPYLTGSASVIGSGFTKNNESETIYMKVSYGTWLQYRKEDLTTWATFYYQNGKSKDGRNANAWNFNIKADYTMGSFALGAGATIISGEKPDDDKDNQFDLLYGVRHAVYGYMDYFNNLPKATANGGLNNIFLTTRYALSPKATLSLDYHYFALNQQVEDLDMYLGSEFDLGFAIRFSPEVNLTGGYSVMLPGSTMEIIQGYGAGNSTFSSWTYLMLTVKPTLFKEL
ncbi:MAG: alginate export family protein [Bacteroidales bacterium]|nr:alginate export family protein [Bacteroidales bacterium]